MAHLPAQCAVGVLRTNSRGANLLERSEMLAGSTGLVPSAARAARCLRTSHRQRMSVSE